MSNEEMLHNAELTVDEALAAHAADLKVSIDWARTRLDRAAALVALAMEPERPGGTMTDLWQAAEVLTRANMLQEDVWNRLQEAEYGIVPCLVNQAFDNQMAQLSETTRWDEKNVRRMTVAELAAALKEEPATAKV